MKLCLVLSVVAAEALALFLPAIGMTLTATAEEPVHLPADLAVVNGSV